MTIAATRPSDCRGPRRRGRRSGPPMNSEAPATKPSARDGACTDVSTVVTGYILPRGRGPSKDPTPGRPQTTSGASRPGIAPLVRA